MDRKLCLSRKNKMIAGVCGGFAEYFNVDPTLIRIIWVILFLSIVMSALPIVVYIICWAIMPLSAE
ncbi:MAG: PspC domain-containing protein [Clostridiales bacterium]|nr:PspC domain-containing protein [Clostridiales bacterium]